MAKKVITGIHKDTQKNLQLGAGMFVKSFDPEKDDIATAKVLGATSGGGTFEAVPEFRNIAENLDGNLGNVKGLQEIVSWEIKLTTTLKECTPDQFKLALGAAKSVDGEKYTKISGKMDLEDSDYIDNICWIGTLKGSDLPVCIQVRNVLNGNGLSFKFEDKNEGAFEVEFTPYFDPAKMDEVPFTIFYPKAPVSVPGIGG